MTNPMKVASSTGPIGAAKDYRVGRTATGREGFTLIELMVALLLLMVILSVALPAFQKTHARNSLYAGARQMAGHIREVQQMAITEGKASYQIYFRVLSEENEYLVYDNTKIIKRCKLPANVWIAGTNFVDNRLGFGATGKPNPTGGSVRLESSGGELLFVIVAVHSGRVRIDDQEP